MAYGDDKKRLKDKMSSMWNRFVGKVSSSKEGQEILKDFPEIAKGVIPPGELPKMGHVKGPGGETFSFLDTLTEPQQQLQGLSQEQIGPLLQQLLGGLDFGPIAQEARTQFGEQVVPSIAERFTGMGQGAQSTEAFKRSLGTAGAGLERGLASEQAKMGSQQQILQHGLLSTLLGLAFKPKHEALMTPKGPGWGDIFAGTAGTAAGAFGGEMFGQATKASAKKLFGS